MTNPTPDPIANDLNLVDYSYRDDSLIGPPIPPPALTNGHQLTKLQSFSENGAGVAGSVNVDVLRDNSTGGLYVVSRGTANLQNALSDLQLANDPVSRDAINNVDRFLQTSEFQGASIEFVGHSFGGNLSLRLASDWISWQQGTNQLTDDQIAQTVSVHTYNAIGVPNMTPQMEQSLAPVTTDWRLVIPGTPNTFVNGMSAGDFVSVLAPLPGQIIEVPAATGSFGTFLDLHAATAFRLADFSNYGDSALN